MADGEGEGEGNGNSEQAREPVPYDRFQKVVQARNDLRTRVADLEGQVQTLTEKGATIDSVSSKFAESERNYLSKIAGLEESLQLSNAGLTTADGQDIARLYFGRESKEVQSKGIGNWLGQFTGEEGAPEAPKALQLFLGQKAPATPAPVFPRPPRQGTGPTPTASNVDVAAIQQARANGDREAFRNLVPGLKDLLS